MGLSRIFQRTFLTTIFLKTLVFFAINSSLSSFATITLIDVEGASDFTGIGSDKEENEAIGIFGGTTGTACTDDNLNTCNNCGTGDLSTPCNESRIYSTLRLRISFSSDNVTGTTAIGDSDGNLGTTAIEDTENLTSGSEHTAVVPWSNVCTAITSSDADCETDGSGAITVGVDGNGDGDLADSEDDSTQIQITVRNTIEAETKACDDATIASTFGLCGFSVFPGDEKVFLRDLEVPDGFPNSGTVQLVKFRFYFEEFDPADASTALAKFTSVNRGSVSFEVEVEKDDDGDLVPASDSFNDLNNGSEYFFRATTVDQAGNIGFATPLIRSDTSAEFHIQGTQSAQPAPVFGLLSENFQCFIATAAYGSPFERHVATLRKFRDRFLNTHMLGRIFVKAYYRVSPPLAAYIAERPFLRSTVRVLLAPAVALAELSLKWGSKFLLLFLLFIFGTPIAISFYLRRPRLVAKPIKD